MTTEQIRAIRAIASEILEAIKDSGPIGAPGGVMYAYLMTQGCTLHQFEQIMAGLVRAGYVTKSGECYHYVKGMEVSR